MQEFGLAHSAAADWSTAVDECAAGLSSRAQDANFGFLYLTDHLAPHLAAIAQALEERTGISSWVGCVGIGICAGNLEIFDAPGLAVMTAKFDAADAIISIAQHAVPKGIGQRELARPQLIRASTLPKADIV